MSAGKLFQVLIIGSLKLRVVAVLLCSAVDALDGEEDFYYTEVEESRSTSSSSSSSSPIHDVTCTMDIARQDATAMDHDYQRKVRPTITLFFFFLG